MSEPFLMGPGWEISGLATATEGKVQQDIVYEVGQLPPADADCSQDEINARQFGVDLRFAGDFLVRADGDLQRTTGTEGLLSAFARSLVTVPGEIHWRPGYGVGIQEFLNLPATEANISLIKNRIITTALSTRGIIQVDPLRVGMTPGKNLISVTMGINTYGGRDELNFEIRRA